jgi:hypothetical protein
VIVFDILEYLDDNHECRGRDDAVRARSGVKRNDRKGRVAYRRPAPSAHPERDHDSGQLKHEENLKIAKPLARAAFGIYGFLRWGRLFCG